MKHSNERKNNYYVYNEVLTEKVILIISIAQCIFTEKINTISVKTMNSLTQNLLFLFVICTIKLKISYTLYCTLQYK